MSSQTPRRLPLLLDLSGRLVVVVGGGKVAIRKLGRLLTSGAELRVIAPEVGEEIRAWAEDGRLTWLPRPAVTSDLEGACLVFLATDDGEAQAQLERAARATGAWVNRADVQGGGDFQVPAEAGGERVRLLASTSGSSPALARLLRGRLEEVLAEGWDLAAARLEEVREQLRTRGLTAAQRQGFWRRFGQSVEREVLLAEDAGPVREEVERCLSSS